MNNPVAEPQPECLVKALQEIQSWEAMKPGFVSRIADFIIKPAEKAAEALIPHGIAEGASRAVENALNLLLLGTSKTVDFDAIQKTIQERISALDEVQPMVCRELKVRDARARESWHFHLGVAVAEGAVTGAGGLAGIAVDIPAIFGVLLRMIQEIGASYGFDTSKPEEITYILHLLRIGSSATIEEKLAALISLKEIEQILIKVTWKRMAEAFAAKQLSKESLLAAIRQAAKGIGIQLTKRKALQLIPIIGAIIGASFNGVYANDIGETAYMSYRRRWIHTSIGPGDAEGPEQPATP